MSDDAPNPEQVDVCKNRVHERVFGKFYKQMANVRDSNRFRMQDCVVDAGNDLIKAIYCVRNYNQGMLKDNDDLVAYFQATPETSKYL